MKGLEKEIKITQQVDIGGIMELSDIIMGYDMVRKQAICILPGGLILDRIQLSMIYSTCKGIEKKVEKERRLK